MVQQSSPVNEERAHARAARLTYVSDTEPGIRRKASGTGFSYRGVNGKPISDPEALKRIRALAVPPAWREVWICPKPNGHIQATGRDDRGRKQYRYHADWREVRDRNKYERILDFARILPRIRERIAEDIGKRGTPREKVLATVVSLLDRTLIRVGNGEYAKQNGSYGLTTLCTRHLKVNGAELRFHFKGKSGKTWRLNVKDRRVARVVRSIQELPGQHLFQYLDDDGVARSIDSDDVNGYLREIAGPDVSAKDFRTWAGTVLAVLALSAIGPFETKTQSKMNLRRAFEAVGSKLGNTPTICRTCYVHPEVVTCYLEGALPKVQADKRTRAGSSGLPREERAVLRLLERRLASRT
jgi:DNA topoisomerase-1